MAFVLKREATLAEDGKLVVEHLPFRAGDQVEITVESKHLAPLSADRYPLRGSVLEYNNPFEPACPPDDWEAQQ